MNPRFVDTETLRRRSWIPTPVKLALLAAAVAAIATPGFAQTIELPTLPAAMSAAAPASGPRPVQGHGGAGTPHIVDQARCEHPEYPIVAIRAMAEGRTVLSLDVDASAHVTKTTVVQPAGSTHAHRLLDAAAAQDVLDCVYDAAHDAAGLPISGTMTVTFDWALHMDDKNPSKGYATATLSQDGPAASAPASP